jgi:hypothetical protein
LFGYSLDGGEPAPVSGPQAPQPAATPSNSPDASASPGVAAGEKSSTSAAPQPQPQPTTGVAPGAESQQPVADAAPKPTTVPEPEQPAEIDQLQGENRQLMQALDVTLANQQDLANQLRKTNEALAEIRNDVALVRERLHDLELAQESHPLPQHAPPAGTAAGVAQKR